MTRHHEKVFILDDTELYTYIKAKRLKTQLDGRINQHVGSTKSNLNKNSNVVIPMHARLTQKSVPHAILETLQTNESNQCRLWPGRLAKVTARAGDYVLLLAAAMA